MKVAEHAYGQAVSGWLVALAFLALLPFSAGALAATAGKVVVAKGEVQATSAGKARALKRRADILEQDTVSTGFGSRTQLRFVDAALITLQEDSALAISEYSFNDPSGKPDRALLRLVRGGLRTVTGSIGKANNEAYKLETPLASIGVRGTSFAVNIIGSGDSMVMDVVVFDGTVVVTTPTGGSMRLGKGEDFQIARVHADGRIEGIPLDQFQPASEGTRTELIDSEADEVHITPAAKGDSQNEFESAVSP